MSRFGCYNEAIREVQFKAALYFTEKCFNLRTSTANPCVDYAIKEALTGRVFKEVKAQDETLEVSDTEFLQINNDMPENIVGYYEPEFARILLLKGKWCISHMIHETLHSRSVFCRRGVTPPGLNLIIEGLNELLTGVVLKSSLPSCYERWMLKSPCFSEPYIEELKTWYYLASKIPFTSIVSLYFDNSVTNPVNELENVLTRELGAAFKDIFVINRAYENLFIKQWFEDFLINQFSEDFIDFYKTPLRTVDVSRVII